MQGKIVPGNLPSYYSSKIRCGLYHLVNDSLFISVCVFKGSPSEEEPWADTTRGDSYILICSHIPMEERKREAVYTPRGSLTQRVHLRFKSTLGWLSLTRTHSQVWDFPLQHNHQCSVGTKHYFKIDLVLSRISSKELASYILGHYLS